MASNEKQFQSEMIRDAKLQGVMAYKNNPEFLRGIPDLTLIAPPLEAYATTPSYVVWLELKFVNAKPNSRHVRPELTDYQRHTGQKIRLHGGHAAWCVCVRIGRRWYAYASADFDVETVTLDDIRQYGIEREMGKPWDVRAILKESYTA